MNNSAAGHGIISITIRDTSQLYASYMPFVKNGGLFVPTARQYKIGDEVFMLLTLMDEVEKIPCAGTVVWITPQGAQGGRSAGIGVQFAPQNDGLSTKIETYLAGAMVSGRPTHTM